jgi:hypothetical protein
MIESTLPVFKETPHFALTTFTHKSGTASELADSHDCIAG